MRTTPLCGSGTAPKKTNACEANPITKLENVRSSGAPARRIAAARRISSFTARCYKDGPPVIDTTGHVPTRARLFRNRGEGEADRGQYGEAGEVFGVSGALALYRREMLDDVAWQHPDGRREWLTEDLFAYFEDVELDWRARRLGWTAWYEPAAVATHERGGAGVRRTPTVEALNWANRLLVIATCDDRRGLLRTLPLVATTSLLKTIELAVTVPSALLPALRRLRLLRELRRYISSKSLSQDSQIAPLEFGNLNLIECCFPSLASIINSFFNFKQVSNHLICPGQAILLRKKG